jgi:hypothetical protein
MRAQMENGCVEGHQVECGFDRYYGENQQSFISTIARAQVKLRIRIAASEEDVGHERKDPQNDPLAFHHNRAATSRGC